MEAKLVTKPGFKAVGFKQTVTFEQAQAKELHGIINKLRARHREIPHIVNPDTMLALSHPVTDKDFTFYILMEVTKFEYPLPQSMMSIEVPTHTYATCYHEAGQNIDTTYTNIHQWIKEQGLEINQRHVTHLEKYPMTQDLDNPDFDIMIPVHEPNGR